MQIRPATPPTPAQASTGVVTRAQPAPRRHPRILVTGNRHSLVRPGVARCLPMLAMANRVSRDRPAGRRRPRMPVTVNRDSRARLAGRRRLRSVTTGRRVRLAPAWPGRALRTWALPRRQTRREATSAHQARRTWGVTAAPRPSRPLPLGRPGGPRNGPGRYFGRRQPAPSAVPRIRTRWAMPIQPRLPAAPITRALPAVPESLTSQFIRSRRPLRSG
jgi:hypothetical protein